MNTVDKKGETKVVKFQAVKELQSVFKCHIDFPSNLLSIKFFKREYDPLFYPLMFYLRTVEEKHAMFSF